MEELKYFDIDPEFEDFTDEFPDNWDDLDGFFELDLDEKDEDVDLRRIEDY